MLHILPITGTRESTNIQEATSMSTLIVPIDGTDTSLRALQYAITLARQTNELIVIINVQPKFQTPNLKKFFSEQDILEYQEQQCQEALVGAVEVLDSLQIPYETKLLIGQTAQEVCNIATELDASTIIMGSRGAGAVKGMLLGSVSYGVLHEATCPVTIVK